VFAIALLAPGFADAGTSCTTRQSGSTTITSCSDSGHNSNYRQCRSYKSGSTIKTSCR
jgi:hypothetical protein